MCEVPSRPTSYAGSYDAKYSGVAITSLEANALTTFRGFGKYAAVVVVDVFVGKLKKIWGKSSFFLHFRFRFQFQFLFLFLWNVAGRYGG